MECVVRNVVEPLHDIIINKINALDQKITNLDKKINTLDQKINTIQTNKN